MVKIQNFDSFGGCVLTFFAPINVKFGMGSGPAGNVSPLRGEKHIFGPLSKNNIGMAAFRAGLPVKIF